jgi:DNA-directed RNA polymerase II subunit RPB2
METVIGKKCALTGTFGDATPFSKENEDIIEKVGDILVKEGYNRIGTEVMYSGFTGEPLKSKIFIGPTYYQRLKHMVSSKLHSRNEGFVTTLTRQPLEGRSRDGGKRLPQWKVKLLLVYVVVGNISKFRGRSKVISPKS